MNQEEIRLLIANIFSLLGSGVFIVSSFMNDKKKMLYIQTVNASLTAIACFVRGTYPGAITNVLGGTRNFITAKGKTNKWLTATFCILTIILGIIFNDKGWVGILPIIASVEYIIITDRTDNIKYIRIALLINTTLWATHNAIMLLVPGTVVNIFVTVTTIVKLFRERKMKS